MSDRLRDFEEIKVLVVDDSPLVRSSLRRYFATTEDIRVVAEACHGVDALAQLEQTVIDIVLADIHMPTMDGVALLHQIRSLDSPPEFLAITAFDDDSTMLEVLSLGAAGYIVKSNRPHEIIQAVRDAVRGGTTVSPQSMTRLARYLPKQTKENRLNAGGIDGHLSIISSLTPTEKRVLDLLCEGKSNTEIARAMYYSEASVKKYITYLFEHFGVRSRLSLVVTVLGRTS